ncbi:MAG: PepSY domain-containing protein [Nanoarchaeota archaeon]|nr:PepSY domain-containing protein [Nanoarchaeota archaeon]
MRKKLILVAFLTLVLTSLVFAQSSTGSTQINVTSGGNTQSNVSSGNNLFNCPQYMPPAPGWCSNGTIVPQLKDENGCDRLPKCIHQSNVSSSNNTSPRNCNIPACVGAYQTGEYYSDGCSKFACPSTTTQVNVSSSKTGTVPSGTSSTSTISVSTTPSGKTSVQSGNAYAVTSGNLSVKDSKLIMQTSKGESKEIKIMPDTASEKAIATLQLKQNVTIELKDAGKPVYVIEGKKDVKVFALFKAEMKVQSEIDAETGEFTSVNKPWWSFLVSEA